MRESLFIFLQHCTPQHKLSRLVGFFAKSKIRLIKNLFIRNFAKKYAVDLTDAQRQSFHDYSSFNDFFTRELKPEARPIDSRSNSIVSPADGCFSQLGRIDESRIFQAKGHHFDIEDLLAKKDLVKQYSRGHFATVYLSPKDYHRVHMPTDGTLTSTSYVPGDLFSVNNTTAEKVSSLFARNERLVCHFDTAHGPMCVILVGAMIVAGIETVWSGSVAPAATRHIVHSGSAHPVSLKKGEELGRFMLGSTVILLFPENTLNWCEHHTAGSPIKMGEAIGTYSNET